TPNGPRLPVQKTPPRPLPSTPTMAASSLPALPPPPAARPCKKLGKPSWPRPATPSHLVRRKSKSPAAAILPTTSAPTNSPPTTRRANHKLPNANTSSSGKSNPPATGESSSTPQPPAPSSHLTQQQ